MASGKECRQKTGEEFFLHAELKEERDYLSLQSLNLKDNYNIKIIS